MNKPTNDRPQRGAHLRWVRLGDIHINPRAQREFNAPWAAEILANWDLDKFQVPTVNIRDGKVWMVDGQHGTWGYRKWSGDDEDQQIQVWAHEGLTEEQEAELFLSLNHKKNVGPLAKFRAAVTAGRPVETDIDRIVRAQGCFVTAQKMSGAIRAVAALSHIYQAQGAATLARTIATIRDAYGDEGYEKDILRGVALVIDRYSDMDHDRLLDRLRKSQGGSKGLLNRANVLRAMYGTEKAQCVAAAVVDTYNQGRGGRKVATWWHTVALAEVKDAA